MGSDSGVAGPTLQHLDSNLFQHKHGQIVRWRFLADEFFHIVQDIVFDLAWMPPEGLLDRNLEAVFTILVLGSVHRFGHAVGIEHEHIFPAKRYLS